MPRPVKCRKVCHFPNVLEFLPADDTDKKTPIVLTVDEYETIRLLNKKGYSQEQCAVSMQIARTTVQRIYEIARKKIADFSAFYWSRHKLLPSRFSYIIAL